ncbi:EamA family transporter [Larkinella humicola]|uniref:EamA family transporter n=2 Tax=Larkinella humicola TaxID=2607654 RepID=A0A5N1J345_9BACT|nr:EamA family transporter [Larkinella humicola]
MIVEVFAPGHPSQSGRVLFLQGSSQFRALGRASVIFLAISGVTTSLSRIFYYRAIKLGPVSQVALIDNGSIVIALLLSVWLLKEPLTLKTMEGAFLIRLGLGSLPGNKKLFHKAEKSQAYVRMM